MDNPLFLTAIDSLLEDYCITYYEYYTLYHILILNKFHSIAKNVVNHNTKTIARMVDKLEKQRDKLDAKIRKHLNNKKDVTNHFYEVYRVQKIIEFDDKGTRIEYYAENLLKIIKEYQSL